MREHMDITAASYQEWPVERPQSTKPCALWHHNQLAVYMRTMMGGILSSGHAAPAVIAAKIKDARATIIDATLDAELNKEATVASGAVAVLTQAVAAGAVQYDSGMNVLVSYLNNFKEGYNRGLAASASAEPGTIATAQPAAVASAEPAAKPADITCVPP